MEILNISGVELLLVAIIALLLLGPDGTVKFMSQAGKLIRKIVRSPIWKDVMNTSKEIRNFPSKIAKEAELEEELKEFQAWRSQTKGIKQNLDEIEKELRIRPIDVIKADIAREPLEKQPDAENTKDSEEEIRESALRNGGDIQNEPGNPKG
jgi:Sec-independent protein translocase protein TatA